MEALGVASGIAGLIALTELIATKGHKYYSRTKGARAEINEFVLEMQRLYGVLNRLRLLAICLEEDDPSRAAEVTAARLDNFEACWKNLLYLKTVLLTKNVESKTEKMIWPFKTTETKELVLKIARNRDDLSTALTADSLTALLSTLSSTCKTLDSVEKGVEDLKITLRATADEIIRKEKDKTKKKIYNWCSTVNPYQKHENSKSLQFPDTVVWVFECDEYIAWTKEDNSSLWLYGIPGAGKTILTCALIEELKGVVARTSGLALAYFYCENNSKDTQILSNMVGSFVKQLAAVSTEAYDELLDYYTTCYEDHHNTGIPKASELCELLLRISRHFDSVLVIVDGIDECMELDDREAILDFLSTISSPQSGTVKIVCTSRNEIDMRERFTSFQSISIAARGTDLELYVAATIVLKTDRGLLRIKDPNLKGEIIHAIVNGANGMFQWAKCQINQICDLNNDKQRRNALKSLPRDLFETYQRILERLEDGCPENKDLCERSLRWLACAGNRMNVESFLTAIAIDVGTTSIDEDCVSDETSILRLCRSLVSMTTDGLGKASLQLSHFTVNEFLSDPRLLKIPSLSRYYLDTTTSDIIIARVCLTYLNMECFSRLGLPATIEDLSSYRF